MLTDCVTCQHINKCDQEDRWNYCINYKPKPQTNADRIRSMTDEELAEWLVSIIECDDGCPCIKECGEKEELGFCYPSMLNWLRKECDDTQH